MPPLRRHHLEVLEALRYLHDDEPDYVHTFSRIGEITGDTVLKSDIRRIVRFLKRRGYVRYTQAFSMDDCLVSGSGHQITQAGLDYLKSLTPK